MLTEEQIFDAIAPFYAEHHVARAAAEMCMDEYRAIEAAACAPLLERIAELGALSERIKLEAQCHAQEARTANATIAEIYQLCSGGTGEPGNWNGAEPVRLKLADLEAKLAQRVPDGREAFDVWAKNIVESDPEKWPLLAGYEGEDYWAYLGWQGHASLLAAAPAAPEQQEDDDSPLLASLITKDQP